MTAAMSEDSNQTANPANAQALSSERTLMDARRSKAAAMRRSGSNPFANDVTRAGPLDDLAEVRRSVASALLPGGKYDATKVAQIAGERFVHTCGRVLVLRSTGKLTFAKLRSRTGEIQLMLDQAKLGTRYERLAEIDVGDFVEAFGALVASKRGELSIFVSDFRVITKAYRPLPEKWHGLVDVELRYRQRYVDLVANPAVMDVFRARSHIVRATRAILDAHDFLEVETPTMHTLVGGAAARPFVTHHNALDMRLFMRIAPELYLKRLVVGGIERVYEIGRCYRNEGISTRHNPEFTMLEFYQAYATYDELMDFTEVLLRGIDDRLAEAMPEAHAAWKQARPFALSERFERVTMDKAIVGAAKALDISEWTDTLAVTAVHEEAGAARLVGLLREDFGGRISAWAKASARSKSVDWSHFRKTMVKCSNDGERFFACYEYLAEPFLTEDYRNPGGDRSVPVFIKDYPADVSPLARRNDVRPELTDRFELFVNGKELCNAFSELNDPDDQADRFRAQRAKRAQGDDEAMDFDEDYIRALEHGLPPTAGFGMGIDRLVMALTGAASIRDVILFPLLRPEAT
jgi:lysyl-tRNA synthetase class 2